MSATYEVLEPGGHARLVGNVLDRIGRASANPASAVGSAAAMLGDAETASWTERTTAADGAALIEAVRGNTLRWGQLVENGDFTNGKIRWGASAASWDVVDGVAVLTATGTYPSIAQYASSDDSNATCTIVGHQYLAAYTAAVTTEQSGVRLSCITYDSANANAGGVYTPYGQSLSSSMTRYGGIFTATKAATHFIFNANGCVSGDVVKFDNVQLFDLTAMFGSGKEPSTVAEFEALFPEPYYPYDAGSLLPVRMEGVETTGDGWTSQRVIPASTYFPDGMRSAGTVRDELRADAAITRVGERAYQSGDESNANVITDGTVTHYALATPTTTPIDPPLTLSYRTGKGGTERVMVAEGTASAPPIFVTRYPLDPADLAASIAPVDGPIAKTNHQVGDLLMLGFTLCKATQVIVTGETIEIGTNVTKTTVAAELAALS